MPLQVDDPIPAFSSLGNLNEFLKYQGCRRCELGLQPNINGCCVSRGTTHTTRMIIGEAPGKDEDSTRMPFTGPAGRLLDRIWASVGWNTNDWYLTNTVFCRPVAPSGSGKQNLTPKTEQRKRCNPFMRQQISMLNPSIIVTLGGTATAAMVNRSTVRMGDYRGKLTRSGRFLVFPMFHPAAILHARRNPKQHKLYRELMWKDIQQLKLIIDEQEL